MSKTILLADDSVTIQKVIELTFMDQDHRVETVGSGDAAIARLEEFKPDFVITDVHMPGADGYAVARRSKALYPEVPVLLLVGTFEPFDEGDLTSSGADRVLKKPFDSQELMRLVAEMSSSEGSSEEPTDRSSGTDSSATESSTTEPTGSEVSNEASAEPAEPFAGLGDVAVAAPTPSSEIDPFDFGSPVAKAPEPAIEVEVAPVEESFGEEAEVTEVSTLVTPPGLAWEEDGGKVAEDEVSDEEISEDEVSHEGADEDSEDVSDDDSSSDDSGGILSDDDIERIARRVADLVGEKLVRQVAWDVIPDMAEIVIRERLKELESQVE